MYRIIHDEPTQICATLDYATNRLLIQKIVFNGGTSISARDTTYDAIPSILIKTRPGLAKIFRFLSYQDIGSVVTAVTYQYILVFSLPSTRGAVQLDMEKHIFPELIYLVTQIGIVSTNGY